MLPAWDKNGDNIADTSTYFIKVSAPSIGKLDDGVVTRLHNYGFVVGPQCNLVAACLSKNPALDRADVPKADLIKVANAHYNLQVATLRPQEEERRRKRAEAKAERAEKYEYCARCSCTGCAAKRRKL
jgi:hypothetical protein